ncbi:MAG: hypothetical protein WA373_14710 [Burkholderiales bacterium]
METRLTLRPGAPGTRRLLARFGARLVCVRHRDDDNSGRRVKAVEPIVGEHSRSGRARKPRRNDHDPAGVRIGRDEAELRAAVKRGRHPEAAAAAVGTFMGRGACFGLA